MRREEWIRSRFGKHVRRARTELGISETAFANMLGFKNRSSISQLELGRNGVSLPKVVEIIDILGIEVSDILNEETNP